MEINSKRKGAISASHSKFTQRSRVKWKLARLFFLLLVMLSGNGCVVKPHGTASIQITPQEMTRLKDITQLHVFTYPTPPFLLALPTEKDLNLSGLGALLSAPFRTHGLGDAVRRGQAIPAKSWLVDPTSKLRDLVLPSWQQKVGLTRIPSTQRSIDSHYTGYIEGGSDVATFEVRVMEWGLYYYPPQDHYLLQVAGRARLLRPGLENVRWSAYCVRNTDPALLTKWTNDQGRMLKSSLDKLLEECANDLLGQFVRE